MSPNEFAQRLHLDLAQFIARTRGVFELLAWGSDVSRNATARRMGHDLRSFDLMREAPSMMLLVDLARACGWSASAIFRIASSASPTPCASLETGRTTHDARDQRLAAITRADLLDDPHAFTRLAEETAKFSGAHTDFAMSCLLHARALCATGRVDEAARLADLASQIGFAPRELTLANTLLGCVRGEHILGVPWQRPSFASPHEQAAVSSDLTRALSAVASTTPSLASNDAVAARERCHTLAESLCTSHPPTNAISSNSFSTKLCSLNREVNDAIRALEVASCGVASARAHTRLAWCCSIAAVTALRLLAQRLEPEAEAQVLRVLVLAQFALEEQVAFNDHDVHFMIQRRRARLILCEWDARGITEELDGALIDEAEVRELCASVVCFPKALESVVVTRLLNFVQWGDFRRNPKFALDALSSDGWMCEFKGLHVVGGHSNS